MPNATLHLSRSSEGFKVKVTHVNLYPAAAGNPRFVAMNVEETIDRPGCYVTMGMLSVHAEKAKDLDGLIGGLKRMRELLASAEAVESDNKRAARICCNCGRPGTEENPLVAVESTAAYPEGLLHGSGCPAGETKPGRQKLVMVVDPDRFLRHDDPAAHSDSGDVG